MTVFGISVTLDDILGKSVGLSCILVWRHQEKELTSFCSHKSYAFVFTDSGVQGVSLMDGIRIEQFNNSPTAVHWLTSTRTY